MNKNTDWQYAEAQRAIQLPPREPSISFKAGWPLWLAAGLIFAIWIVACSFDYAEALEQEADMKVFRAERAANFTFPISYDAVVTQSLPSGRDAKTVYYSRTSNREGK